MEKNVKLAGDPIEAALLSYPLAPAPAAVRARAMARIRAIPAVPAPGFAFPWLEASLSLIAAAMVTVAGFALLGVSPVSLIVFRQQVQVFLQNPTHAPLIAAITLILILLAGSLLGAGFYAAGRHPVRLAGRGKTG